MFQLHERLAADTLCMGDLPLSRLLLMNDTRYPWFILVPRQPDLRELHQLSEADLAQFMKESMSLSRFLEAEYKAEKINIAALGNMVPQLHIHHLARFSGDDAWPGPVWGVHPPIAGDKDWQEAQQDKVQSWFGNDLTAAS